MCEKHGLFFIYGLGNRNIQKLSTLPVEQINTYDVVANAKVVLTKAAAEKIQEVYGA